ncbi:MAG: hypothetical protein E5X48_11310 [Mesorhizobium sp.]|uniref:hypothetical protein n=1 Tax=Mesorhizobium sp. TaxID=1871066 RepID=UPI00122BF931|nr:hypothetical protein [Mesorhizobium sp.]TIQ36006.1 MAG: hypothetical protein E5X48_11310 [Mesorhizobium sp.]
MDQRSAFDRRPRLRSLRCACRIFLDCGRSFDHRMLIQSEALRQKRHRFKGAAPARYRNAETGDGWQRGTEIAGEFSA